MLPATPALADIQKPKQSPSSFSNASGFAAAGFASDGGISPLHLQGQRRGSAVVPGMAQSSHMSDDGNESPQPGMSPVRGMGTLSLLFNEIPLCRF